MACPAVGDRRERLEPDWHKPLINDGSGNFEGLSLHPLTGDEIAATRGPQIEGAERFWWKGGIPD
jgi:hypothetical protein